MGSRQEVERLRKQYPEGTRIKLEQMNDPYCPVAPGTMGTVKYVDDVGTIHVKWDDGRGLGLVPGEDSFSVAAPEAKNVHEVVKTIEADELRYMKDAEGLVFQGCGGNLQEWVDGINNLLAEEGILRNGTKFENISTFHHDGRTNLLFSFDGADLDVGRLAMWRIQTYQQFEGVWLSDYVPIFLGGFVEEQESKKPDCALIGEDGNIFNLMGIAGRTLREHGLKEQAKEMRRRVMDSGSYPAALGIIGEYVNIISVDEQEEHGMGFHGMG